MAAISEYCEGDVSGRRGQHQVDAGNFILASSHKLGASAYERE